MTSLSETSIISGASGQSTGYTIDQSIRFNPGDTPYMHKTYSGAGDRTAWTFSTWFKLGYCNSFTTSSGPYYVFFACDSATNDAGRGIFSMNNDSSGSGEMQIQFQAHGTIFLLTDRMFKDPSAWYHLTLVWDSDNTYAYDRCRLYINGVRETQMETHNNPSSGQEIGINLAAKHTIGAGINISTSGVVYHFDGYMANIHFLDGYSYGPEYFGEFKENTSIWIPKEYDGSYGTNGFFIDGRDSADLDDDESGQNNDYTASGLAAADQFIDTPTDNYCVLNPLSNRLMTFSNGNMEVQAASGTTAHKMVKSTMGIPPTATGKYFWEWQVPSSTGSGDVDMIGLCDLDDGSNTEASTLNSGHGYGIGYKIGTGEEYLGTGWTDNSFTFGGFVASNYYGFAYDASTGRLYIYQNGTALNSGNHVATFDRSATIAPGLSVYNNTNAYKFFNGAQNSLTNSNFNYAPKTGYGPINSSSIGTEF